MIVVRLSAEGFGFEESKKGSSASGAALQVCRFDKYGEVSIETVRPSLSLVEAQYLFK